MAMLQSKEVQDHNVSGVLVTAENRLTIEGVSGPIISTRFVSFLYNPDQWMGLAGSGRMDTHVG